MTRKLHGPKTPEKKDTPTPASALADRCLAETPAKGYGMYTLGRYLGYLEAVREYCRSVDDLSYRGSSSVMPEAVPKNLVLDAIGRSDKSDQNIMKALLEIADRADDKDIRAAAQEAVLLRFGRIFTGITPRL